MTNLFEANVLDPKIKYLFDQMPGAWGCKDKESTFIYANEEYGKIIGVRNHEDITGMTDYDMPCDTVKCAGMFREQDKTVISTGKRMRILDIHPFSGQVWKAYIFTKTPLLNEEKRIVGTVFHGMDITDASMLEMGTVLTRLAVESVPNDLLGGQTSYLIGNNFKNIKLTERQSECLFYLLRGKTAKQMAKILNISHRTIEEYLEQLKCKFNVVTKYDLINKAIECGYLNVIPETLFNRQLSLKLMIES